jgi:hypothetical protein
VTLNNQYNADDSRSQRTASTTNPLNPSAAPAGDPDYIKLANALPDP